MRAARIVASALTLWLAAASLVAQSPPAATGPAADACAKPWLGHETEFEAYLKTAKVTSMKEIRGGRHASQPRLPRAGRPVREHGVEADPARDEERILRELSLRDRRL